MNTERIDKRIDTKKMSASCVAMIGLGGGANLARNLARCNLGSMKLADKDHVGEENICRQEYAAHQVGMPKAHALAEDLKRIHSRLQVRGILMDVCEEPDEEIDLFFGDADLFVAATDNHPAQARVSQIALRRGKPAVFIGLSSGGAAGSIFFWHPGLASCYRCAMSGRYKAAERGTLKQAESADILSSQIVDGIAGMIIIGLLTRGSDTPYGRLIDQLGDRQYLQIKLDPAWTLGGRDVVRDALGVPEGNDAYVSFCTVARRDPDPGGQCPDCRAFRRGIIGTIPAEYFSP